MEKLEAYCLELKGEEFVEKVIESGYKVNSFGTIGVKREYGEDYPNFAVGKIIPYDKNPMHYSYLVIEDQSDFIRFNKKLREAVSRLKKIAKDFIT